MKSYRSERGEERRCEKRKREQSRKERRGEEGIGNKMSGQEKMEGGEKRREETALMFLIQK